MKKFVYPSGSALPGLAILVLVGGFLLACCSTQAGDSFPTPRSSRPSRKPQAGPSVLVSPAPLVPAPQGLGPSSGDLPGPLSFVSASWEGMSSDFFYEPPDPHGAAGPNGIIQVVNVRIAYFDKSGNPLWGPVPLDGMFRGVGNQFFSFDPHALYDPGSGRFYVLLLEEDDPTQISYLDIAVSKSSHPLSSGSNDWFFYRIDNTRTVGTNKFWGDYPGLGFDSQAIYTTVNMFSFTNPAPGDVQICALNKNNLINGTTHYQFVYTSVGFLNAFTLHPCTVRGTNTPGNVAFFAETPLSRPTAVRVWALSDPLGAATLASTAVTIPDN